MVKVLSGHSGHRARVACAGVMTTGRVASIQAEMASRPSECLF